MKFQTKTIHAGHKPDPATGAIIQPIYQTNIFAFEALEKNKGFEYSRMDHPNRKLLEENLAALEGGKYCTAYANGQAAEISVLSLFKTGDHIICGNDVYSGTIRLLNYMQDHFGLEVTYVPMMMSGTVASAVRKNTRALWIETPSNPLLNIVDLQAMTDIARSKNILTIVDNTLLTPCFQQPFKYGADMVLHSASKYLGGHNDVLGGAVITNSAEIADQLILLAKAMGTSITPFDSWLIMRGLKTLAIRMREHEINAIAVAHFLAGQKSIKQVYFPGLATHPQFALIQQQMTGFGGVISFEVAGGRAQVNKIFTKIRLFYVAQSFGGVESIIEHPKTMSHKSMSEEAQKEAGITDGLIRLSVGLEDKDDLIHDLEEALA